MEVQRETTTKDVKQIRVASEMEFATKVRNFINTSRGSSENSAHMILTLRGRKYAGFYPAERYNNQVLVVASSSLSYSSLVDLQYTYLDRDEKRKAAEAQDKLTHNFLRVTGKDGIAELSVHQSKHLMEALARLEPKPKPLTMPLVSIYHAIKGGAEVDIALKVREKEGSSYTRHAHVGFGSEVEPRSGGNSVFVLNSNGPISA